MAGFSMNGLVTVYTVHAGRKWCQGISIFTWCHESNLHSRAYAHTVSHTHSCTNIVLYIVAVPASGYLLHKWLFALSQHLILYYVIKAAWEIDADAQSLHADTPEPLYECTFSLFVLVLSLWSSIVLCILATTQWTTVVNIQIVSVSVGFSVLVCTRGGVCGGEWPPRSNTWCPD